MERKKREAAPGVGRLPAMAPLANPYVPFQVENPTQYEARNGLVRGTLYPGLDLPFMGKVNKKPLPVSPMSELQALAFAIQELALYLDTHSNDTEALELYRRYQQLYHDQNREYVRRYGPVCHKDLTTSADYSWLSDPWPWEYCGNREG